MNLQEFPDRLYSLSEKSPEDYAEGNEAVLDAKVYISLQATCFKFRIAAEQASHDSDQLRHLYLSLARLYSDLNKIKTTRRSKSQVNVLRKGVSDMAQLVISGKPKTEPKKPEARNRTISRARPKPQSGSGPWVSLLSNRIEKEDMIYLPSFIWSGDYRELAERLSEIFQGYPSRFILGDLELVKKAVKDANALEDCPDWLKKQIEYVDDNYRVVTPWESLAIEFIKRNFPTIPIEHNIMIEGYECDILLDGRVIYEFDPKSKKRSKMNQRDQVHKLAGYEVVRVEQKTSFAQKLLRGVQSHFPEAQYERDRLDFPFFRDL